MFVPKSTLDKVTSFPVSRKKKVEAANRPAVFAPAPVRVFALWHDRIILLTTYDVKEPRGETRNSGAPRVREGGGNIVLPDNMSNTDNINNKDIYYAGVPGMISSNTIQ